MREVFSGRADRVVWTFVLLTVAVLALMFVVSFAAPAGASSPAPVLAASSSSASPSGSPAPAPTLSLTMSHGGTTFGTQVTASGVLEEPAAGEQQGQEAREVVVTLGGAEVGRAFTGAGGEYSVTFMARKTGVIVATLADDPTVQSQTRTLTVKPRASVARKSALVPFLTTKFVVTIRPTTYNGLVVLKVVHRKATVGTYKVRARNGQAVFQVPLRGVDGFTLTFTLPAGGGLAARTLQTKVSVPVKTLKVGSKGAYVKGMLTGLQRLKFRIPGMGTTFSTRVKDSVMAFQKAYKLKRSYVFNAACWRKLDTAKLIKARRSSPSTHIEVDKTRQILMIVKGGKPWGIICVSTGATGNTPVGTFRIQQKHPYTSTFGGGGTLTRTMGFYGNFAIHGWPDVPPYPASHGCVREPIWASYWTYDNSWVGETVYIYR